MPQSRNRIEHLLIPGHTLKIDVNLWINMVLDFHTVWQRDFSAGTDLID